MKNLGWNIVLAREPVIDYENVKKHGVWVFRKTRNNMQYQNACVMTSLLYFLVMELDW